MKNALSLAVACLVFLCLSAIAEQTCKPKSDKAAASGELEAFGECKPYQNYSCCSANYTRYLRDDTTKYHDAEWDKCGRPSEKCLKYLLNEVCFFHCDPYLSPWEVNDWGTVSGVPVCKSFCDDWFDACRDAKTCAMNWKDDYNKTGGVSCKVNSTCKTFREMYGNAQGLCEKMWGTSFVYDEDEKNCMVMTFAGKNPNKDVRYEGPTSEVSTSSPKPTSASVVTRPSYLTMICMAALGLVLKS